MKPTSRFLFFSLFMLMMGSTVAQLSITSVVNHPLCYADTTGEINLTATGGTPPYGYLWSDGSTNESNNWLGAGTYDVTVFDSGGLSIVGSFVVSEPDELELFISPDQYICYGMTTQVFGQAMGGIAPYTYYWNPGGIGPETITVTPSSSIEYALFVRDANYCKSQTLLSVVNVYPELELEISAIPDSIALGGSSMITLVNASGGNNGPYSLQVITETGTVPMPVNGMEVFPAQSTMYIAYLDDYCGTPTAYDSVVVYVDTSSNVIENIEADLINLSVAPNPFTDYLNIKISARISDEFNVALYDVKGQLVQTFPAQRFLVGTNHVRLKLENHLAAGTYFLKANWLTNGTSIKLIKE